MERKITLVATALACMLLLNGCGSMPSEDRETRGGDWSNRFSPHTLTAIQGFKMWDDVLVLRKNKTFVFRSKVLGILNSGYYCGTYTFNNNIICLQFSNNHVPGNLDDLYIPVLKKNGMYLQGETTSFAIIENYYVLNELW